MYSFGLTVLQFALGRMRLKAYLQLSLPTKGATTVSVSFINHKMMAKNWRPSISSLKEDGTPGCIVDLIKLCWLEDPEERPSFEEIENTYIATPRWRYSA